VCPVPGKFLGRKTDRRFPLVGQERTQPGRAAAAEIDPEQTFGSEIYWPSPTPNSLLNSQMNGGLNGPFNDWPNGPAGIALYSAFDIGGGESKGGVITA
jgi:hypothetical protein